MEEKKEHEALVVALKNPDFFTAYKTKGDAAPVSFVPRIFGAFLIFFGTLCYGRAPSYLKFRAIEVIARVPYHSWAAVSHTLLTVFYQDEEKARALSKKSQFALLSQDNETMHVVVISCLAKEENVRGNVVVYTLLPMVFAFFYFWASYVLYLIRPRWSFELNYLFEDHALEQYTAFLHENEARLKEKAVTSSFLSWYGRPSENQYDFFESVRNDELIHRNKSLEAARDA